LLFIIVKKLNRLAHVRCKKARDNTQEVRINYYHFLLLVNPFIKPWHKNTDISATATGCISIKLVVSNE